MADSVYALRAGDTDLFKIGYTSRDVHSRLSDLQTGCPFPLRVFRVLEGAGREVEARMHNIFSYAHTSGEWFDTSPVAISEVFDAFEFALPWASPRPHKQETWPIGPVTRREPCYGEWVLVHHGGYPITAVYSSQTGEYWSPFIDGPIVPDNGLYVPLVGSPSVAGPWMEEKPKPGWPLDLVETHLKPSDPRDQATLGPVVMETFDSLDDMEASE